LFFHRFRRFKNVPIGKNSISDRHPICPKLPKTSKINIALHVSEEISDGKVQMSE